MPTTPRADAHRQNRRDTIIVIAVLIVSALLCAVTALLGIDAIASRQPAFLGSLTVTMPLAIAVFTGGALLALAAALAARSNRTDLVVAAVVLANLGIATFGTLAVLGMGAVVSLYLHGLPAQGRDNLVEALLAGLAALALRLLLDAGRALLARRPDAPPVAHMFATIAMLVLPAAILITIAALLVFVIAL